MLYSQISPIWNFYSFFSARKKISRKERQEKLFNLCVLCDFACVKVGLSAGYSLRLIRQRTGTAKADLVVAEIGRIIPDAIAVMAKMAMEDAGIRPAGPVAAAT